MVADVVKAVGGERAQVTQLIGNESDPRGYEPSRGDVAKLLAAELVFYSGFKLEEKMNEAVLHIARAGREVHAFAEALPDDFALHDPSDNDRMDPHICLDVTAWMSATKMVETTFSRVDPMHAEMYRSRSQTYLAGLQSLDAYVREITVTVPPARRMLVVAHDAYRYFGRAYGFEAVGIGNLDGASNLLVRLAERKIPAIFSDSAVSDQSAYELADRARADGHPVIVVGPLFSERMGEPSSYEGTYIGMIDHDVTMIVRALGGKSPERGFQGRLQAVP